MKIYESQARQAGQGSTEMRGTRARSNLSARGANTRGADPICPSLVGRSTHTSELTFRSVDQFRIKRQGQGHEIGGCLHGGLGKSDLCEGSTEGKHPLDCAAGNARGVRVLPSSRNGSAS